MVAMTVDVAPQAAYPVEILLALDVYQHAALGPLDDQRLVLGHLGKCVPDEFAVPGPQLFERRFTVHQSCRLPVGGGLCREKTRPL